MASTTTTAKKTTTKTPPKALKKRPPLTLPAGLTERLDARATLSNIRWHRERARDLREEARPGEAAMIQVAEEHEALIDLFNELRAARRRS